MEMLLVGDRRAARRCVLVDCQVVRERDFSLLGERALDLSLQGMLLYSKRRAEVGEEVIVTFRVPGTRKWIDTTATVARVIQGRRPGDRGPALGLWWGELPLADERLLRSCLTPFPPTLPARPIRIDYAATAAFIALS